MRHVLIALLLVSSTAYAANWVQIAQLDSKGSIMLVDTAGIASVNDLRKAWFKSVYTSDQRIPRGYRRTARIYRWELRLSYFNCSERAMAVSQSILNSADDKVVGSVDTEQTLLKFREVGPETISEKMLETICNWEFVGDSPVSELAKAPLKTESPATVTRAVNPADFYPSAARRHGEMGAPVVQACVGPTGMLVREPVVTQTSGFPALDSAAIKVARAMQFAAGTENGAALPESCVKFRVKFDLGTH
jgi:TonB family protein